MCLCKAITGLPCPGCGMTRAFLHFFQGDLKGAFYYHPLFWLVPILFGLWLFSYRSERASRLMRNNWFWGSLLVLLIGVYAYRMGQLFPQKAPLDFDAQAPIPRVLQLLGLVKFS